MNTYTQESSALPVIADDVGSHRACKSRNRRHRVGRFARFRAALAASGRTPLQAAEQNLGLALAREILAADALRDGRLVRLSATAMHEEEADAYWLAFPPGLVDWAPLVALGTWLLDELAVSQRGLEHATSAATGKRRT